MRFFRVFLILFLILNLNLLFGQSPTLENKKVVYLSHLKYDLILSHAGADSSSLSEIYLERANTRIPLNARFDSSTQKIILPAVSFPQSGHYRLVAKNLNWQTELKVIPNWLSILPPFVAIVFAMLFRQVIISLFFGIWLGVTFLFDYNPFSGFLNTLTEYIGKAPTDPERMAILIFSLALGGMVGVISRSGGTMGIVHSLRRFASNRRKGQLATWLMGVLIFFDDYANTLIVGNTMRPLTDRLKISREKLSYLVDSTAAPVATMAIISTWIGYQLSLMNDSFQTLNLDLNAYIVFIKTIPYNFYPIFSLMFGFFIAFFNRDLFSMYRAEKRCVTKGAVLREGAVPLADLENSELKPKEGVPLRWYNALIPILVVIITTLSGLWFTGYYNASAQGLLSENMSGLRYVSLVVGSAESFSVLMWASFSGGIVAIVLALVQRILNLDQTLQAWVGGVKAMVMAAIILTLAWAIGNICTDLQTANYVIYLTRDFLSPHLIPVIAFISAGIIALSTGTSWGTMAILIPIVIPMAYQLPKLDPTIGPLLQDHIFLSSIASILAGATFGDHCSPISDTTIMSSMATGADHVDHVRTQLPYALISALISLIAGYLLIGYGASPWLSLFIGLILIILIIRFLGKKVE
ncbi:Na+/H+ antiporter NhaC family protein [Calditrichota bacterium GD2]